MSSRFQPGTTSARAAPQARTPAGPGVRRFSSSDTQPLPHERLLHLMQYRSFLAAAAGGAAAFADVAAARRAHLGAAGEAERSVRGPAQLSLDQFGRAVRSGREGGGD